MRRKELQWYALLFSFVKATINLKFVVHISSIFFLTSVFWAIYFAVNVLVEGLEATIATGKEEGRKITGAIAGSTLG